MKLLVAIALLVLAVTEAHHSPEHTLRGPRFKVGNIHKYNAEFNVTSGVLGLSSQVSKTTLRADVSIYAKTETEHILKIENVQTSGSLKAVDSKESPIPLQRNSDLESRLSEPIKFTLENGEVTSYTLSPRENLESKKIKKSILRSLEMHIPETALLQMDPSSSSELSIPVIYNITEDTDSGEHTIYYMITVSPYPEFPANTDVYNISRSDNFEGERYPSHKLHHNFGKQGCPEVCRKDWTSNTYGAGCPVGYEPHHTPLKTSFNHLHHLSLTEGIMNPEIIETTEIHVANMYDQDMEVLIKYQLRRTEISTETLEEPSGHQTYTDLKDLESEINEKEIDELCNQKSSTDSISSVNNLLNDIARVIIREDLEHKNSPLIGYKLILLKDALIRFTVSDFRQLTETNIRKSSDLASASHEDRVKRAIFLDLLPVIGTEESVTFIAEFLKKLLNGDVLIWEAKEILELLPENIHQPSEKNVRELRSLITDLRSKLSNNHILHSAVHLAVARVLGSVCGHDIPIRSQPVQRSSWFRTYEQAYKNLQQTGSRSYEALKCPEGLASEFIKEITESLKASRKEEDITIYLETLTTIGTPEILTIVTPYIYGIAENIQEQTPSYIDFLKTVSLYALHNLVGKHPEDVLDIVLPVFFNETENPKIRNAAFSVLIRAQPSLEILQHVAIQSWTEDSNEVGSYVTSTLETFGNSSLPCMQLTSHRIKMVLPQLKRSDTGLHNSKSLFNTYFDENREFGLEHRLEYSTSNESIIPSTLYKSLSYSSDSLRDVLFQIALNVQGFTQEKVIERIEEYLGLTPATHFTPNREKEIFEEAILRSRLADRLRLTIYKRIFYSSSFYHLDLGSLLNLRQNFLEYVRTYLGSRGNEYSGLLVKTYLPSTFHAITIAKTLPYPIEFEMKQPLIMAFKIKTLEASPSLKRFHLYIGSSIYFTKLYSHQFKNLGDCKEIGVYHENKAAWWYPLEIKYDGNDLPNITIKYKVPQLHKRILCYQSEAGTYAGKEELESLPSTDHREPITTTPSPFRLEKDLDLVGFPPMHMGLHYEDISLFTEKTPRDPTEALDILVRKILNAGWRHISLNITLDENSRTWPKDTEVALKVQYSREHISKALRRRNHPRHAPRDSQYEWAPNAPIDSQYQDAEWNQDAPQEHEHAWPWRNSQNNKEEDWSRYFKPDDITHNTDPAVHTEQGKTIGELIHTLPHIAHALNIEFETTPVRNTAYLRAEHNHTYSKSFHTLHLHTALKRGSETKTHEITLDHVMAFLNKPNEFKYNTHTGNHQALYITALGLPNGDESDYWENVQAIAKGKLEYESLEELFKNELLNRLDPKHYLPEHHEQCLSDTEEGKSLSLECTKAIRERSIFNKVHSSILWNKETPELLKKIARRADLYTKHFLFHYLNITDESNTENRILILLNYIDKFTDEPLFDLTIEKPTETIEYNRVPTLGLQLFSSIYTASYMAATEVTNNTYPPTCVMMKNHVRTYDLKTYQFSPDRCNYILTTHCAERKHFAITAKALDVRKGTKEIIIYIGESTITLTPKSGNNYKIKYNGADLTIDRPILLDSTNDIHAHPEELEQDSHIRVIARRAGVNVLYDGENVKIELSPRYKGELCGLCSEFDGEELREYRGLDRCLYTHPIDFANSAITNRQGSCEKTRPYGEKFCDDENDSQVSSRKSTQSEGYKPSIKRNIVVSKGSEFCFSLLPYPVCNDNAQPMKTEPQVVAFHCLPRRDITAKKLLTESKRRVLGEIAYKSEDFEHSVQVAKMC